MKGFLSALQSIYIKTSPVLLGMGLVSLTFLLDGCGIGNSVDSIINEVDRTRQSIVGESSAWRNELPKLVDDLNGMESNISADAKGILADTTNQVQDLTTQTIQFSDAKAQDLIAQAGVEFRCNADFVKAGAVAELQAIEDDLKFWKQNKTHLNKKPNHAVCWINPTALSLYPSGNNWLIDTNNMSEKNIVHVFGYNFWSEQLPTLQLQNASGTIVRNINLRAAYVTHYQINLDFSTETFPDAKSGERVVFNWPDQSDPNTINLTLNAPGKLKISGPVFSPSSPVMLKDQVSLKVTVANQGGSPVQDFVVKWQPDPNDGQVFSQSAASSLKPGESRDFNLGTYKYKRDGQIQSVVTLSTGDDILRSSLNVLSNIAGVSACDINEPVVTQRWTQYPASRNSQCALHPGDMVQIADAGGCVNTGGHGDTTKLYVNPVKDDGHTTDSEYFGMIAVLGTLGEAQNTAIRDFIANGNSLTVGSGVNPVLELGYVDDDYGDNGYSSFDNGVADQCRNVGHAYIRIRITHYR